MNALPEEDPYGLRKRFEFVRALIEERRPAAVAEIGCGSGAYLLLPLARAFPAVRFLGVDPDAQSIAQARRQDGPGNLDFAVGVDAPGRWDLVIASEVIEHVEHPVRFLAGLRAHLHPGGTIVLTTPNGYGPFEWASLLQSILQVSGALAALGRLWRRARGREPVAVVRDSYAVSPHINFFSWRDIHSIIAASGCRVLAYRGRTWLCGFGLDLIGRWPRAARFNARLADRLSPRLVSDWMFVIEPGQSPPAGGEYVRGSWVRMRRALNEKACGAGRR
ncbi:MAG: class I SAM-dependent methyltransferase [Burkholderiales bacterium]|nr:class I SAM-dependent methyltransferase [Burkholderiales bacterium]